MITLAWHDAAKTIIYQRFAGEWVWEDYEHALDTGYGMLRTVPHRVDFIIHMADDTSIKISPGSIERWRSDLLLAPANLGCLVHVSSNAFFAALIPAFATLAEGFAEKVHLVTSVAEAEVLIATLRTG